jgi:dihydroxyacetone kinase phosphotransfer subunit
VDGVRELAAQMAPGVPIAVAGGTDDGGIGTSFDKVLTALDEVGGADGVVVLYDLGSARMTAEMAFESRYDDERRAGVRLVDAPLVEGAIAAAVAAAGGLDLDAVAAVAVSAGAAAPAAAPPSAGLRRTLTLRNPLGLHARAAATLVRALAGLDADVRLGCAGAEGVDARSILGLVGLGVSGGAQIEVVVSGPDAEVALARVDALVAAGFGELDEKRKA